ncbi:MAG: YtxH domain-containing protein [Vampirovibrionales bacterium]
MSSERFLGGFILGGAIGALIGLLFAPAPGARRGRLFAMKV